jgi:glycosyltransferase involved in cell wall biosynthesis
VRASVAFKPKRLSIYKESAGDIVSKKMAHTRRVLLVQFAGDYREAYHRLSGGGAETYYAQRYSVDSVAAAGKHVDEMAVFVCLTPEPYDEVLPNGVRAIGGGFSSKIPIRRLLRFVETANPTELILCTPVMELLRWAIRKKVRTLAVLADSFPRKTWRSWIRNRLLAGLLNNPRVEWVANHNINASRGLEALGVDGEKIIPYDWIPVVTPNQFPSKSLREGADRYRLAYVGQITDSKGVRDLLEALAKLKQWNISARLRLAGKGQIGEYENLAKRLGIEREVEFLGLVAHDRVVHLMRDSDAVVIPSRHDYPEGLPFAIYEALCSRTPIIASDHPMFAGKLADKTSALIFPAGDSGAMAERLRTLFSDSALYAALSSESPDVWARLQIPVKFGDLINRWISNTPEDKQWLSSYRLASGSYDRMP